MKDFLHAIFRSYAEIFFLQGGVVGAGLCVVSLFNPNVGLAGLISVLAAYGFARLIRMHRTFLESGYYTFNPLLVGLSLGYLYKLTPVTVFFIVAAGVLTIFVTIILANIFALYFKVPILSLPFVVVSTITYLASLKYSNLVTAGQNMPGWLNDSLGMPLWLAAFFKALGAMFFTPSAIVGLAFALILLLRSRILFLMGVVGFYAGTSMRQLMLGSPSQAYGEILNFNFILIGMAVGGVFLVPSLRSYLIAIIAVLISTLILDASIGFWARLGIPAFTLPFNLAALSTLYVLGLVGDPAVAQRIGRTPEETLGNHLAGRLRFPGTQRTLALPFSGRWTVWQGFDGEWTHKGPWKYACDFVITDTEGSTHRGEGEFLNDYYCFKKPVLSPVKGRVVEVTNDLPDNPVGEPDKVNNWGNCVLIEDPRGFHVALAHFEEGSIQVKKGDWVERGAPLGRCGNSGYSPQPHIHIHAQLTDKLGDPSAPFSWVNYAQDGEFHSNDMPEKDSVVEPLPPNRRFESLLNLSLDEEYTYLVTRDGAAREDLKLVVKMGLDGVFYLDSGRGTLSFGRHEGTFYFYQCNGPDERLVNFFLASPRIPAAPRAGLTWHDYVPPGLVGGGWRGLLVSVASSVYPKLAEVRVTQRFVTEQRLETTVESPALGVKKSGFAEFDHEKGFKRVAFDGWEFTRVDGERDD